MTHALNPAARCYDGSLTRLLLWLAIPLLFLPKINLIQVQGQTAGLRLDDLILLAGFLLVLLGILYARRPLLQIEQMGIYFIFSACFSLLINGLLYRMEWVNAPANPLYVIRLIEYFTFFYIGRLVLSPIEAKGILYALFVTNVAVIGLQWLDLIGGFTPFGYMASVSSQPTGLTAGHWEVGLILNYMYAIPLFSNAFANHPRFHQGTLVLGWMLINALTIAVTGSRSAALGMVGVTLFWLLKKRVASIRVMGFALLFLTLLFLLAFSSDLSLFLRSRQLFSGENVSAFMQILQNMEVDRLSFEDTFQSLSLEQGEIDLSWYIRMHKWGYIVKYFLLHPANFLFGLGPGFFGTAVDGGWLRLIAEYGLVGGGLFIALVWKVCRTSSILQACFVAFALNMIFIDIFLAYKDMSVFFFLIGLFASRPEMELVFLPSR